MRQQFEEESTAAHSVSHEGSECSAAAAGVASEVQPGSVTDRQNEVLRKYRKFRRHMRQRRFLRGIWHACGVTCIPLLLFPLVYRFDPLRFSLPVYDMLGNVQHALMTIYVVGLPVAIGCWSRVNRELSALLARDDPDSAGIAIEALSEAEFRDAAVKLLTHVLSDACRAGLALTSPQIAILCRELKKSAAAAGDGRPGAEWAIAVLRYLAREGDAGTVDLVARLAVDAGQCGVRVKAAAQESLAVMRSRLDREQQPRSLLRAGTAPPDLAGQLLRPAAESETQEPEQLLRAVE